MRLTVLNECKEDLAHRTAPSHPAITAVRLKAGKQFAFSSQVTGNISPEALHAISLLTASGHSEIKCSVLVTGPHNISCAPCQCRLGDFLRVVEAFKLLAASVHVTDGLGNGDGGINTACFFELRPVPISRINACTC